MTLLPSTTPAPPPRRPRPAPRRAEPGTLLRLALGGAIWGVLGGVVTGALGGGLVGLARGDISLGLDGALLGSLVLGGLGAVYGTVLGCTPRGQPALEHLDVSPEDEAPSDGRFKKEGELKEESENPRTVNF